ncbi:MAG: EamA family transporter [Oscillospiraceae bacterium]|nr:EamA family transporter [Oscillospiraceae bacterium]
MNKSKLMLVGSMVIFGTIGVFRRYIDLPSGMLAFSRGLIGVLFLLVLMRMKGERISGWENKSKLVLLLLSGVFIGFNWILLFEAYRYTSVATATLCYYMAPIFVLLAMPVLLRERLSGRKLVCVLAALLGMVLVSGVLDSDFSGIRELRGVFLGLGAAVLYAGVVILNKKIGEIEPIRKTTIQLAAAAASLLPYVLLVEDISLVKFTPFAAVMLLIVGVVHTGFAYAMYFGSMNVLSAQTVALFSYIDPVVAVLLSALLLHEGMSALEIMGAVLVLGSTVINEISLDN